MSVISPLPPAVPARSKLRTALIVDDNALNSRLVALYLKRLGWATQSVDSGAAALERLAGAAFDLVLLDLRMPGISGERVCETIRADPRQARLRIVAYTAHSTIEEKERMLAVGFDGLLVKPIAFSDVQEICHAA